jgi:hypothetical protein
MLSTLVVQASGLVKRATDQLVDAARKMAAHAQEMDVDAMDFTKLSHAVRLSPPLSEAVGASDFVVPSNVIGREQEYKVKQVNQMAKIFELEKEVSKQREVLTKYVPPHNSQRSSRDCLAPFPHSHVAAVVVGVVRRMRKAEYSIVNPYANTRGEL